MIPFYIFLAVIAAIPAIFLIPSLLWKSTKKNIDPNAINTEITKSRIEEISRQPQSREDREIAELELQQTLADDLQRPGTAEETKIPGYWNVIILISLPLASFYLYNQLGHPDFISLEEKSASSIQGDNTLSIGDLLSQLERKIAEEPDNPGGWELAGRTYMSLGEYAKADRAYKTLNALVAGNPDYLTAWADASIMADGNAYTPEIKKRIDSALSIDPGHINALWIAGLGEQSLGNYEKSTIIFNRLISRLGDDRASIDRVKALIERNERDAASSRGDDARP